MVEVYIRGRPTGEASALHGNVRFWRIHGAPGVFDEQMLICGYCQGLTTHEQMTKGFCKSCNRQLGFEDVMAIKAAQVHGSNAPYCSKCHVVLSPKTVSLKLICPSCGNQFTPEKLHDSRVFSETPSKLAQLLEMMVTKMNFNVCIKLVRDRTTDDVRRLSLDRTGLSTNERTKRLNVVRSSREEAFYPRHRIEADLATGASLVDKIEAFLKA